MKMLPTCSLIINNVTLFSYIKEVVTTTLLVLWPPSTSMNYVSEHTDSDNINNQELIYLLLLVRSYVK